MNYEKMDSCKGTNSFFRKQKNFVSFCKPLFFEGALNSIMFRISILPYSIIQMTIRAAAAGGRYSIKGAFAK